MTEKAEETIHEKAAKEKADSRNPKNFKAETHLFQEFRTEVFFPNNHFDYEKVTYDTSALDVNTPGVYMVPVLYDGEATNCVVEGTVKASETDETQETAPAGSGEAWEEAETE